MTLPLPLCRSWLFVGGAEQAALDAVPRSGADVAILELEDFTPPALRPAARAAAPALLDGWRAAGLVPAVRVNPFWDGGREDLAACMAGRPAVVMLPKVRGPDDVVVLDQAVAAEERRLGLPEGATRLAPNCESARALFAVREIATASPRVVACLVASEDLAADLGAPRTPEGGELAFARAFFHAACIAAGVLSIDCPYTFADVEGAARHARQARALGYTAKSLVDPAHAAAINAALTPSAAEIGQARRMIAAFTQARTRGEARVLLDGHALEVPTLRNAQALLERAAALGVVSMPDPTVDRAAVLRAEALIRPHVRTTPVIAVAAADLGLDAALPPLTLKLEYLQRGGSFKARGAFANLLGRKLPPAGVVAASGGNHGVGVALAAAALGVPASIFVPSIASPAKIAEIRGHGARLVVGGERYADALAASEAFQAESGALPVHAYDQAETLAGQGTVAVELERQAPALDTLLVAVGGGGLLGGIAAYGEGRPKLVAVEPETAPTLHHALAAGRPVEAPAGGIAADSLAPRQVGRLMFPLAQRHVAGSVLVEDAAIRRAQHLLWQRLRIVVEPGGAAALAALASARYRPAAGERVGLLLCGANTDVVRFPEP